MTPKKNDMKGTPTIRHVRDQRSVALRLKAWLAPSTLDWMRRAYNRGSSLLPTGLLYAVHGFVSRRREPYLSLEPGAEVVQVGAARDLLRAGRSRWVQFSRIVGPQGRVLVIEADPLSAKAALNYAEKHRMTNVEIVHGAVWDEKLTLKFMINHEHPASNYIKGVEHGTDRIARSYEEIDVPAKPLSDYIDSRNMDPRLISITTNGAELAIVSNVLESLSSYTNPMVSVAFTTDNLGKEMNDLGFELLALDDRGGTYRPRYT